MVIFRVLIGLFTGFIALLILGVLAGLGFMAFCGYAVYQFGIEVSLVIAKGFSKLVQGSSK